MSILKSNLMLLYLFLFIFPNISYAMLSFENFSFDKDEISLKFLRKIAIEKSLKLQRLGAQSISVSMAWPSKAFFHINEDVKKALGYKLFDDQIYQNHKRDISYDIQTKTELSGITNKTCNVKISSNAKIGSREIVITLLDLTKDIKTKDNFECLYFIALSLPSESIIIEQTFMFLEEEKSF